MSTAERSLRTWAPLLIWLIPVVLVVLTRPVGDVMPLDGSDRSAWGGIAMAFDGRLDWGRDITYTWGPFGFMQFPAFWSATTGTLGLLYTAIAQLALCATVFFAARRSFGVVLAAALAYLAVTLIFSQALMTAFFIAVVCVVTGSLRPKRLGPWAVVGGVAAGTEFLVRPSWGVATLILGLIAAVCVGRPAARAVAAYLVAFVGFVALVFILQGESVAAFLDWLPQNRDVVSGFVDSGGGGPTGRDWTYLAAIGFVALGAAGFWLGEPRGNRRARLGAIVLWLAFSLMLAKEGFTSNDPHHNGEFFSALVCGALAAQWTTWRRWAGLSIVIAGVAVCIAAGGVAISIYDPGPRVRYASDAVNAVIRPANRDAAVAQRRAFLRGLYAVPPQALALVRGRTVHIAPFEAMVAWTYQLRWRPLPDFQPYTAWTPRLDGLDASFVTSPRAPEVILENRSHGVFGHWASWDSPRTALAILCRYHTVYADPRWHVLARGPGRCGRERPLGTVRAAWSVPVRVPRPSGPRMLVILRVRGTGVHGLEKLRSLLFKAQQRVAVFDGHARLFNTGAVEATPLPLLAGRLSDFPKPFRVAPDPRTIAFKRLGGNPSGRLTFAFSEIPVGP